LNTHWPDHIAVVIPSYKAADLLAALLPRVLDVVPAGRILVVDDASHDATQNICKAFSVACTAHNINKGKGRALCTGFDFIMKQWKSVTWIITMDADGQHSPDDLHLFLEASKSHPSPGICIGARRMERGIMPPARIISNRLTSWVLGLFCGITIRDSQCGYRIYNTALLKRIHCTFNRFEMESEIIMKAAFIGFPVTFVTIQTLYLEGPSHISHIADTFRWISAVLKIWLQRRNCSTSATTKQAL